MLFLTQFLVCNALAQKKPLSEIDEEETIDTGEEKAGIEEGPIIEKEDYGVSETIAKGREEILKQKEQLAETEEKKKEAEKKAEEAEAEAKEEIYQQKMVQEAAAAPSITTIERQLQRERFRRELMTAAGKEIKPPFKLTKRFSFRAKETYDDNIFLTKINKKEDYITTLSPGVLFSLSSKFISFDVNYVMDIENYRNNSKQGGVSHLLLTYIKPGTLTLPFLKRKGGKIGFELQDDFQPLVTSVASSEQTSRTERTSNKLFFVADYYMSAKRTLALEYTNVYQHYRTSSAQSYSYTQNDIAPTFYFHATPKWSLFTGYSYGIIDYPKGKNDLTYQQLRTGITGKLFRKGLGHFEIGREWRKYKNSLYGEAQKIFLRTALLNRFSPTTLASIKFSHTAEESTYGSNAYFISDDVDFNIEHHLTYKTTGLLGIENIWNEYDKSSTEDGVTKKRKDTLWQPSIGLRYHFRKWFSADLKYIYRSKTSNFGKFAYIDNKISAGVNLQF